MRLHEFAKKNKMIDILKLISDDFYNFIEFEDFSQEQKHTLDQHKQKKMSKTSRPHKSPTPKPPKLANPSKPKFIVPPTSKNVKTSQQQLARDKERKMNRPGF
jgi:hypothetical protein